MKTPKWKATAILNVEKLGGIAEVAPHYARLRVETVMILAESEGVKLSRYDASMLSRYVRMTPDGRKEIINLIALYTHESVGAVEKWAELHKFNYTDSIYDLAALFLRSRGDSWGQVVSKLETQ